MVRVFQLSEHDSVMSAKLLKNFEVSLHIVIMSLLVFNNVPIEQVAQSFKENTQKFPINRSTSYTN